MTTQVEVQNDYKFKSDSNRLGLWLFIISDAFVFAGLLVSRFYLFMDERPELNQWLGFGVTLVLLTSSYFMFRAESDISFGNVKGFSRNILITMVLGVLFLIGVVFFLAQPRDVVVYVSLFTVGHSITLLAGVLAGWQANAYLVDAVIGLSVVYKAFENMGGFDNAPFRIDPRVAVMIFGLFHGLGLATRLQDLTLTDEGLITNLLSFNLGVELGQIAALAVVLLLLVRWRQGARFDRQAYAANWLLMTGGFVLAGMQLTGYYVTAVAA